MGWNWGTETRDVDVAAPRKINNTVMFGVGAGFNFFAGTLDKAPEWMEKASLEWLFRLSKEPKDYGEDTYWVDLNICIIQQNIN